MDIILFHDLLSLDGVLLSFLIRPKISFWSGRLGIARKWEVIVLSAIELIEGKEVHFTNHNQIKVQKEVSSKYARGIPILFM